MLKLFFNKDSRAIIIAEALGIIAILLLIVTWWPAHKSLLQQTAFALFILFYVITRILASVHWYDADGAKNLNFTKRRPKATSNEARFPGIELQFKKALIGVSYFTAIAGWLILIHAPTIMLYIADILSGILVYVNLTLLYFHVKDTHTLPVNYFTHNHHLKLPLCLP